MMLNIGAYRDNFIHPGQLYRFIEGRILWVTEGSAYIGLTLEDYHIQKGDIILLTPETIMELKSCSDDYTMMGIIFKESILVSNNIIIHAQESDWNETIRMANLLWDIACRKPFRQELTRHLLTAIISDIQDIDRAQQNSDADKRKTRQEMVFSKFKKLVNEHCCRERSIPFYANELALTPHYLSSLITKISGKSVMYWINRATLVQAKVLLKSRDILISEVADRLNFPSQSAFGYFFKRETGMTPTEYQKAD